MNKTSQLSVQQANQIYKESCYSGRAAPSDVLYGILYHNQPVCVTRLVNYDNHLLLRNLCTLPDYRNQGFASQLLKDLSKSSSEKIFLFSLKNLIPFYLQCGFTPIEEALLPKPILAVWKSVKRNQPGTQPMALQPSGIITHE